MIIKHPDNVEIDVDEGTPTIEAGLSKDSLPFLFEMMSKNLYSNPIGSIIREYTSNCFDSHKEAQVDKPVIVKRSYDSENECFFISFIDFGVGLSPERMEKVFMNWFNSTKRQSDDFIGGFGIGSKSVLSYQDMCYINTVFDGIEYNYIFSKGERVPRLDLINKSETTKGNGTEVKIEIKDGDIGKFETECKRQLCYFDNVFFDGFNISNFYKIYDKQYFKYRNKDQYSGEMHIILEKVAYPINWKELGRKKPVEIPIGVKFEIGELLVTPNREELRYTEDVKKLVNERIEATIKEITDIFNNDNPDINDIFEYIDLRKKRPAIIFSSEDRLELYREDGFKPNFVYGPLKHLPITIPSDIFFMYEAKGVIEGENFKGRRFDINEPNLRNSLVTRRTIHGNKYKNAYISESNNFPTKRVFREKEILRKEICERLGLYVYRRYQRGSMFDREQSLDRNYDYQEVNYINTFDGDENEEPKEEEVTRKVKRIPLLNKAFIVKEYLDHVRGIIRAITIDYDQIVVPEEWVKDYKNSIKESSAAYLRKINKKVIVKCNGSREEIAISRLMKYRYVFYEDFTTGKPNRDSKISSAQMLAHVKTKRGNADFKFIEVTRTNLPILKKNLKNLYHVNELPKIEEFKAMFSDIKTIKKWQNKWWYGSSIFSYSTHYKELQKPIRELLNRYSTRYINEVGNTYDEVIEKSPIKKKYDEVLEELDSWASKVEILEYLTHNCPERIVKQITSKLKITKLNGEFYSVKRPLKYIKPKDKIANQEQTIF